jgi:hypothetical protein
MPSQGQPMMPRVVTHEALDDLDKRDPLAVRSRHDLRRVHLVMGTRTMVVRAIRSACAGHPRTAALHVLELGAGDSDGNLMLGVARQLADEWTDVRLTLLERQGIVTPPTLAAYKAAGWSAQACVADALAWADGDAKPGPCPPPSGGRWDLVIANLFLHHFEGAALIKLLGGIERSADRFIAFEPARSRSVLSVDGSPGQMRATALDMATGEKTEMQARVVILANGSWGPFPSARQTERRIRRGGDLLAVKANFVGADLAAGVLPVLAFEGGYGGIYAREVAKRLPARASGDHHRHAFC